tara:strand:- start:3199 stop:4551 length:1353 start_codon:yes stop_codon:yes gene_type:complete
MERYDSYKDSGVEWIGEIPSHWNFGDMRYQLSNNDGGVWGKDIEGDNEGTFVIRSTEITIDGKWDLSDPMRRLLSNSEIEKTLLFEGDIVLTKSSGSPDHIGKSVIVNSKVENLKCCYSNFVQRIRFKKSNPKLYHYILNNYIVREQYRYLTQSSTGLGNLNGTTLNEVKLPFIPLSEQQQIVSFLDNKTTLIDSLIEKTQQKIELLKEKRTSLINEVVTKGLNPNVEMKESGVEWIGEIPSHWEIKRVKHLIEDDGGIKIGPFGSSLKLDTLTDDGIKVYGQGNVIKDDFTLGHRHIPIERFESDFSQYEILEGDILITMMGTTGKSKVFKREFKRGILDSHLLRLRFKRNSFLSDLFVTTLQESDYVFHQLKLNSKGSIMEGLNSSIVKELILLTPPISEQQKIVEYLDEQTGLIDKTISIEEKRIELLKEYRQSLISEVVTGKRKVV